MSWPWHASATDYATHASGKDTVVDAVASQHAWVTYLIGKASKYYSRLCNTVATSRPPPLSDANPTPDATAVSLFRDKWCLMGGTYDRLALDHPQMYPDSTHAIPIQKVTRKNNVKPRVGLAHIMNDQTSRCLGLCICPNVGVGCHLCGRPTH